MGKRSEGEVLFQEATVVLGGVERTLKVRSLKDTRAFREQVGTALAPYIDVLFESDVTTKGKDGQGDIDIPKALGRLLPRILGQGVDNLIDLAYAYVEGQDESLKAAMDEASDKERLAAGLAILKVTLPFVIQVATVAIEATEMASPGRSSSR